MFEFTFAFDLLFRSAAAEYVVGSAMMFLLFMGIPLLLCDAGRLRAKFSGRALIPAILATILWFLSPFVSVWAIQNGKQLFFDFGEPMGVFALLAIAQLFLLLAFYLCCILWKFAESRTAQTLARLIPVIWLVVEAYLWGSYLQLAVCVLLLVCLITAMVLGRGDDLEDG